MKIIFHLEWCSSKKISFKHAAYRELLFEYTERISKFTPCEVKGPVLRGIIKPGWKVGGLKLWLCDFSPGSRQLSSEDLAQELSKILHQGVQSFHIVIGGPDGISPQDKKILDPDLRWSFGPLTLAHELASVVAAEQLYRAWTQLRKLPYHLSHK